MGLLMKFDKIHISNTGQVCFLSVHLFPQNSRENNVPVLVPCVRKP